VDVEALQLEADDVLVMYTDGMTEAESQEANRGDRSGSKPCCEIAVTARPLKYSPAS